MGKLKVNIVSTSRLLIDNQSVLQNYEILADSQHYVLKGWQMEWTAPFCDSWFGYALLRVNNVTNKPQHNI